MAIKTILSDYYVTSIEKDAVGKWEEGWSGWVYKTRACEDKKKKKKDRGYSGTLERNSLLEWGVWASPGKDKFLSRAARSRPGRPWTSYQRRDAYTKCGLGNCHISLEASHACLPAKSLQSCLTLWDPMNCSPPGSPVHGDSPGKNTRVGCHSLLQRVFPIQGWNLSLLAVFCVGRWVLYLRATGEPRGLM